MRILKANNQFRVFNSSLLFSFAVIGFVIASLTVATAEEKRLEVTGNIESENGSIFYSVGDMAANKSIEVVTTSPWTIGKTVFRGVLLRDVLDAVKADGNLLDASAIDGYTVEIPVSDARKYDVIIAYSIDGKPLEEGVYAPFWIIYPYDSNTTLANEIYYSRSIWQLTKLVVK